MEDQSRHKLAGRSARMPVDQVLVVQSHEPLFQDLLRRLFADFLDQRVPRANVGHIRHKISNEQLELFIGVGRFPIMGWIEPFGFAILGFVFRNHCYPPASFFIQTALNSSNSCWSEPATFDHPLEIKPARWSRRLARSPCSDM